MPSRCAGVERGVLLTEGDGLKPWVAVTFDEHLGPYTLVALAAFKNAKQRGTFFTVGQEAVHQPGLARAIIRQGHEIGNHSWDHTDLTTLGDHGFYQMWLMQDRIRGITGFKPCLMRPPYGNVDDDVIAEAEKVKLSTVKWSYAANIFDTDPSSIATAVLANATPGAILLLHQIEAHVRALPAILSGLVDLGLKSVPAVSVLGGAMA